MAAPVELGLTIPERIHKLQSHFGGETIQVSDDLVYEIKNGGPTVSVAEQVLFEDDGRTYSRRTHLSAMIDESGGLTDPSAVIEYNSAFKFKDSSEVDVFDRMNSIVGTLEQMAENSTTKLDAA